MRVFDSLDAMLSADGLAPLVGAAIVSIARSPLAAEHFSGNTLARVQVQHARGTTAFVLKRFSYTHDWVMRLTHDTQVREVALYRSGVYARMPAAVWAPLVACARDGDGWASLMCDVSDTLVPNDSERVPARDVQHYLGQLAALHAHFMRDESLSDPALGLSSLYDFVTILSPDVVRHELAAGRAHPVLQAAQRGWQLFDEIAPPRVVQIIHALQADPAPLLNALSHAPRTLVHGDFKFANLGLQRAASGQVSRVIVLDWQDAAHAPPLLDLGYFLAVGSARLPVPKQDAIQIYRDALQANGYALADEEWVRAVELGLLTGGALRLMWQKALGTQSPHPTVRAHAVSEVEWWSDLIVRAARWLEEM